MSRFWDWACSAAGDAWDCISGRWDREIQELWQQVLNEERKAAEYRTRRNAYYRGDLRFQGMPRE